MEYAKIRRKVTINIEFNTTDKLSRNWIGCVMRKELSKLLMLDDCKITKCVSNIEPRFVKDNE